MLYLVQAPAALGVTEQTRARDVIRVEGFPVNPAEFTALQEVELRVEDDVHQHLLHLRDRDAPKAVQRRFGGEGMQDDAAGGAAKLEELLPGGIGKDRQTGIFFPKGVREGSFKIAFHVHDYHIDLGNVQHEGNDAGDVPDTEISQRIALPEVCAHFYGLWLQGEEVAGL